MGGGDFDWNNYSYKLKSRVFRLLIPYILWNIIAHIVTKVYQLVSILKKDGSGIINIIEGDIKSIDFFDVFIGVQTAEGIFPANGPLWFVRELMFFVIISPLIYCLIKKTAGYGIILLATVDFLNVTSIPSFRLLLFFSAGACISINYYQIHKFSCIYFVPFVFILPLVRMFVDIPLLSKIYGYIYPLLCFFGYIGICYGLSKKLDLAKFAKLSKYSFMIFASHFAFIPFFCRHSLNLLFDSESHILLMVLQYFTEIFCVTTACVFCYIFLSHLSPKCLRVLTGDMTRRIKGEIN